MSYIKCGNCLELMKEIPDESVDLVITDPPYKTITGGNNNGAHSIRPRGNLSGNKKLFTHQTDTNVSEWMPALFRVLKNEGHCYVFTNSLNLENMLTQARQAGFGLHNVLVWEKNNCTPSQFYMKNCEYILFLRKGRAKWINNIGASKTVHQYNNIIGHKNHPTEKPIDLLSFYILNSSHEHDIVLDPFMGSGSTCIAALNTNRQYIGFELDRKYFDIAESRIIDRQKELLNEPIK